MRPRDSKNQQNRAFLNLYLFRRVAKQPRFCESSAHQQTYTSGEELSFFSGVGGGGGLTLWFVILHWSGIHENLGNGSFRPRVVSA